MKVILDVLKPLVISYLTSDHAKETLVEILEKLAAKSENKIDDGLVEALKRALGL